MKTARICMWLTALCITLGLLSPRPAHAIQAAAAGSTTQTDQKDDSTTTKKKKSRKKKGEDTATAPAAAQPASSPAAGASADASTTAPKAKRSRKKKARMPAHPQRQQQHRPQAHQLLQLLPLLQPPRLRPVALLAVPPQAQRRNLPLQRHPLRHKHLRNPVWFGSTRIPVSTTKAAGGMARPRTASG